MALDLKLLGQLYLIYLKKDLDELHRKQLYVIVNDNTATKQQIRDNIQTFFDGIGGDVKDKFIKIQNKLEAKRNSITINPVDFENGMSKDAKAIFSKAHEIKDDFSITPYQEKEKLKELFNKASDDVKNELKALGLNHRD